MNCCKLLPNYLTVQTWLPYFILVLTLHFNYLSTEERSPSNNFILWSVSKLECEVTGRIYLYCEILRLMSNMTALVFIIKFKLKVVNREHETFIIHTLLRTLIED